MFRKLMVLCLALVSTAPITGCSKEARSEDVDKAADVFFERLKSAEYDAIYDDAAQPFKEQNSRAATLDNLKQIAAMGRIMKHTRLSMSFDKEGGARICLPAYAVIFDAARAEITLKFLDAGGEWKVLGFFVKTRG
ncbi:MAG TPA: hypothetical protein VJH03_21325 [Blastocatellia bacterium]|nr:hypothetical protein [Blastocatellia bacterium]